MPDPIHGSKYNRSAKPRRFLLQAYAAADAWPLADLKGDLDSFNGRIVRGEPTLAPRMEAAPVRMPMPTRPDAVPGSIYDQQSILKNRFVDALEEDQEPEVLVPGDLDGETLARRRMRFG